MFSKKIFKIAYAISIAEGWFNPSALEGHVVGSASYRNHNPGNLKTSIFEIDNTGDFSIFENDLVGYIALVHQLYLYASDKTNFFPAGSTLYDAICVYNGTDRGSVEAENYISIIEKVAGVSRNDSIESILN